MISSEENVRSSAVADSKPIRAADDPFVFSQVVMVAIAPLVGYASAYAYRLGEALSLGIPVSLVDVSGPDVLVSTTLVLIAFMLLMLLAIPYLFVRWRVIGVSAVVGPTFTPFALVILAVPVLAYVTAEVGWSLVIGVFAAVAALVVLVDILVGRQAEKPFRGISKIHTDIDTWSDVIASAIRHRLDVTAAAALVTALVIVALGVGVFAGTNRREFLVSVASPGRRILATYGSRAIIVSLDKHRISDTTTFTVVDLTTLGPLKTSSR